MSLCESSRRRVRASRKVKEQLFRKSQISKFGEVALILWPGNAPSVLAGKTGVSERAVNNWIKGRNKPSGRALLVVMDEID